MDSEQQGCTVYHVQMMDLESGAVVESSRHDSVHKSTYRARISFANRMEINKCKWNKYLGSGRVESEMLQRGTMERR